MKKILLWKLVIVALVYPFASLHAETTIQPPKNPNSAKACAICHYRWIDTFFIEGRGSDLVEYTSKKYVATPEMCFSCHDGSVADSRAKAFNTAQHKTNLPPPSNMTIPDIFPLDEQGRMQCATCHTAHGVPSGPDSKETIFMRTSNRNSAMCRMCHPDMTGGLQAGNHSIDSTKLAIPSSLVGRGALTGDKQNQVVCESCHTAHGSRYESLLIRSGKDSSLCLECHRDKEVLTPAGQKRPVHVVNVLPETAIVPEDLLRRGAQLGPSGELICETCHKVHKNKFAPQLLLLKQDRKSGLCLTCHPDKKYIAETKHNLELTAPSEKNLEGNTVADAGVCSACHLPHKAARELSGLGDYTAQLCISCHSTGKVAGKVNLTGTTHPLDVYPFALGEANPILKTISVSKENLTLPLFNKNGVRNRNGRMTCSTCHDTHRPPPQAASVESEATQAQTPKFLRKAALKLCAECHDDKFGIADTKHNLSKTAPEAKNILNQTPSESGLCGTCHLVHGARKGFLWARPVAAQEGQQTIPGLCVSCHNETGIAQKKLTAGVSHPTDVSPSEKGQTPALPLFDRQGNLSAKGGITCQTCHDPHRWNSDSPDIEPVKGDPQVTKRFSSFLRISSPKICGECHRENFQVADTKHDLSKTAPQEKNILNQTSSESGLCGSCHLVHNAQKSFLWAREMTVERDDVVQGLCIGCHNPESMAAKKTIHDYSHPLDIMPSETGLSTTLPLFDRAGKVSAKGILTCHTCHNPHRWNPAGASAAEAATEEGTAQNSFLRQQNSPSAKLCENCHSGQGVVEKTDHDLLITAPTVANSQGQTPAASGNCGACHLVHNAPNPVKLWARPLSSAGSIPQSLCISCHSSKGPVSSKVPRIATHPEDVVIIDLEITQGGRFHYLPLFDPVNGNRVTAGNLSCPSCHNVHQWDPKSHSKGEGINLEGSAMNSFLRAPSDRLMCIDCHGPDALVKYLYFHDPEKRASKRE